MGLIMRVIAGLPKGLTGPHGVASPAASAPSSYQSERLIPRNASLRTGTANTIRRRRAQAQLL
jgi:hypothetical protein